MEIHELVDVLRREGALLADAAARTAPDAPVPTCPGWQLRDLLLHTGQVHRWAAAHVKGGLAGPLDEAGKLAAWGPEPSDAELVEWFRTGHGDLVAVLDAAPADLDCWSFLPAPSPLAFWARRQLHETTVHRVDAESAAGGGRTGIDPAVAADGLDELLTCFMSRPRTKLHSESPRTLLVRPTDRPESWLMTIGQDAPQVERGGTGLANCTVIGPAEDLYLLLWNRLPADAVDIAGDRSLLDLWREKATVVWT
ncbi:maleylpyruvate isomerase family mycothiol-dependent enzyme [Kitasatospora sp. NPDC051914]|uniref:maleylpyruvate isomerase family mycothiol-dependent enzyme n=1 Tax=Kitasatospora sp. NPDC051914 TaxID=3154945 RepID=UPI003444DF6C